MSSGGLEVSFNIYLIYIQLTGNYVAMTSVFQTRSHDECTFCDSPENAYNGASPRRVIDHIFFKGFSYKDGVRNSPLY